MGIQFNGKNISKILFNGKNIQKVTFDNTTVVDWTGVPQVEVAFTNNYGLPWVFQWWHYTLGSSGKLSYKEFGSSPDISFQIPKGSMVVISFNTTASDGDALKGNIHAGTQVADVNPYGLNNVDGVEVNEYTFFGDVSQYLYTIIYLKAGYYFPSRGEWSDGPVNYKVQLEFSPDDLLADRPDVLPTSKGTYVVDISSDEGKKVSVNIPYHGAMTIKALSNDGETWTSRWQTPTGHSDSWGECVCEGNNPYSSYCDNGEATLTGNTLCNNPEYEFTVFGWQSG